MAGPDTTGSTWYRLDKSPTDVYQEQLKGKTLEQLHRELLNQRNAETPTSEMLDIMKTRKNERAYEDYEKRKRAGEGMKKGGKVSSASKRADGIAQRGKTRGKVV